MKKFYFSGAVVFAALLIFMLSWKNSMNSQKTLSLVMQNVEALSEGDVSGSNYHICFHRSKVMVGRTYYDCGSCVKVYDEDGRGKYSKCFY